MAVSLDLAKQHLRLDTTDEDPLVGVYLAAAKAWVESYTGKALVRREVTTLRPAFACYLGLIWGPNPQAVSVAYIDTQDQPQTIDDARVVGDRLYPPSSGWPTAADDTAITLTYTAGFDETPGELDAAVLLLLGDFYANREAGAAAPATTAAVEALCDPYRGVSV